jgi:SAM-dependent methyltransferase
MDWDHHDVRQRLELKQRIQDPATISCLERIGVGPGWRCLEVGAGAGSIAAWLSRRVGPGGMVVAIDLDARFVRELALENLVVREQDAVTSDLGKDDFDLVHARDVLTHIPERDAVLEKMAAAVRPGGWILIEEQDVSTDAADPAAPEAARQLYSDVMGAIYELLRDRGLDPTYGARVLGRLRGLGFESLAAEGRCQTYSGGSECGSPHVPAFDRLREPLIADNRVTAAGFVAFLSLIGDPSFSWREGLTVSTWGRRPIDPARTG